jgi:Na+-driven multidrug efflux pump
MNACLIAGQWLFVGTAALALFAIFADWMRSATDGKPIVLGGIAAGCLGLALLFYAIRGWLDRHYPQS